MTIFCVTKSAPELVRPSEPTPSGTLALSFMDRVPGLRVLIACMFVYRHGGELAAGVIREALSRALVHYYPIAGRIVESEEDGEPEVACTGDGAWFVEASADCRLEDVNFLQLPLMIPKEELLPFPPPKVNEKDLILLLQVTKFTCGGFAVGLRSCHTVFDGVGQAQLLKAVGELARGLDRPLVQPIWCREAIPSPPKSLIIPPPPAALTAVNYNFKSSILDVPLEYINRIKNRFMEETGQRCSTFDIMAAKTWQCRTRVMATELREEHVHLAFAVNMRHLMERYFSKVGGAGGGYYGNCVHNMSLSAPSQRIVCAPLVEVIRLVKDAKRRAASEFVQWVEGRIREQKTLPLGRGTMCVLDWSRVGFLEVDYGWGEPMHGAPLNDHHFMAWCIFLRPLPPAQGGRVVVNCVEQERSAAFRHQMMSLD